MKGKKEMHNLNPLAIEKRVQVPCLPKRRSLRMTSGVNFNSRESIRSYFWTFYLDAGRFFKAKEDGETLKWARDTGLINDSLRPSVNDYTYFNAGLLSVLWNMRTICINQRNTFKALSTVQDAFKKMPTVDLLPKRKSPPFQASHQVLAELISAVEAIDINRFLQLTDCLCVTAIEIVGLSTAIAGGVLKIRWLTVLGAVVSIAGIAIAILGRGIYKEHEKIVREGYLKILGDPEKQTGVIFLLDQVLPYYREDMTGINIEPDSALPCATSLFTQPVKATS
jgi:hypothetical protein